MDAAAEGRELPGVGEVAHALADRARDCPWSAAAIGLGAGYLLGGGFFTRPTRWLFRVALAVLAVPSVRARAFRAWREISVTATTSSRTAASAAG